MEIEGSVVERDDRIAELLEKIQALEKEKEQMVAEIDDVRRQKSDEARRRFNVNNALEAEKKRLEEVRGEIPELRKRIRVLERANSAMQAKFWLNREMSKEVEKEKRAIEKQSENKAKLLITWNEHLMEERREMEAKVSLANVEIERILKEKIALQEQGKKMVWERDEAIRENEELKVQKKELQIENERIVKEKMALKEEGEKMVWERDEAIRVINEENEMLEARIKDFRLKIRLVLKREEDEELAQRVHLARQNQDIGFSTIIKLEKLMAFASSSKHKQPLLKSPINAVAHDHSAIAEEMGSGGVN